jgi:hypothetical protein
VLLVGTKLSAPKRLLQLVRRQNELKTALAILQSVAPIDVTSSADVADAESGFSSAVELGAPSTPHAMCLSSLVDDACRRLRFWHVCPTVMQFKLQVPADARVSELVPAMLEEAVDPWLPRRHWHRAQLCTQVTRRCRSFRQVVRACRH